jgi:hypothetical protein
MRLDGSQAGLGRCGEEKDLDLARNQTTAVKSVARRYTGWVFATRSRRNYDGIVNIKASTISQMIFFDCQEDEQNIEEDHTTTIIIYFLFFNAFKRKFIQNSRHILTHTSHDVWICQHIVCQLDNFSNTLVRRVSQSATSRRHHTRLSNKDDHCLFSSSTLGYGWTRSHFFIETQWGWIKITLMISRNIPV